MKSTVMKRLPEKDLLRPDEVATYLRVSERTVKNWCRDKKIQVIQVGSRKRIPRNVVIQIIIGSSE